MKKVIDGAVYSTETAQQLGEWSNSSDVKDFSYCSESLYRTKARRYFLHGEGGANSKYASHNGDGWSGWGEKIIPMSREAAQKWAEDHLDGDEYEKIFGEVDESDGQEVLNLLISPQLKAKLRELAEIRKISLTALVDEILTKAMNE